MSFNAKLSQPESRKLEFKRGLPGKSDLLRTIVAFANGAGGELVFGVSDKNREIVGVDDPLALEEKVANVIHDGIQPFISPYISSLSVEGRTVLIVKILPGTNKPYFRKAEGAEKGVYIRLDSTNRRANAEMIAELKRQGRGLAFEMEADYSKQPNDLDETVLTHFFETLGQSGYTEEALIKWKILQRNNGDCFPTVAGLVMFGKEHLLEYDFAGIRLTRYQGITLSNISESKEFRVPIVEKIDVICSDIERFLRKESYLKGARRLEQTVIPPFAVREVVVNAVVHRDYSIQGASVKINVFDDRLEVISPGILFGHMDLADIGTGISECRNRSIVRVFRRLNLMEELGTGIARIYELFREKGLKKPEFMEQGQYFKAILSQEKESNNHQDLLLDLLRRNDNQSASELAKQMNLHHNTVLKHLNQLIAEDKIKKSGSGRKTSYRLK
jgi:ATP-dependent DNA helicase RecG